MNLNERFWEIDALRGLAVILMVIYHFIFDLTYFGIYNINLSNNIWILGRCVAFIFIFLVGVSLYLSYSRKEIIASEYETREYEIQNSSNLKSVKSELNLTSTSLASKSLTSKLPLKSKFKPDFSYYLKRGLKIFILGLLITLGTYIFIPSDFVIFGILHFIGLAIILEYPFIKKGYLNLFLGIIFIATGLYLMNFAFNFPWLLWLGFLPSTMISVDYFPILPWLGVVSLGIFAGGILYKGYQRQFKLFDLSNWILTRIFTFLGRHSLIIYFIHQPILILTLYFLGVLNISFLIH